MSGPLDAPSGPPRKNEAVTALGIINLALGGMQFCCGLFMTVAFATISSLFGFAAANDTSPDAEKNKAALGFIGLLMSFGAVIGVIMIIVALLYIAAGFGLIYRRQWGRILTLVLGALAALLGLAGLSQIGHDTGSSLTQVAAGLAYCGFAYAILLNRKTAEEFS